MQCNKAAEKAIEQTLSPYENKVRPFFWCGSSSFNLYIHEASFLGLLLKEKIDLEEYYTYKNGHFYMYIANFSKKFNLTGQEYQIYGYPLKAGQARKA